MDEDAMTGEVITTGSGFIEMAFSKSKTDARKKWLNSMEKNTYLNYSAAQKNGVNYSDFINKELILFSNADNARSIPHIMDGFKPSQRKVLFACFKKKLKAEIKVAQLAGYIGEHSAYHHGDMSLNGTIIAMAQSYVGSNNVNLLYPSGQFGTRRMGGKDHASARYIFTRLEKIARAIFHPDDDDLLNFLNDDGLSVEPEFYMPVIPMVLVNGSDGIGTGYSTTIQTHDPREIIANMRNMINGEEPDLIHPYFEGFTGEVRVPRFACEIVVNHTLPLSYRSLRKLARSKAVTQFVEKLNVLMTPPSSSLNCPSESGLKIIRLAFWKPWFLAQTRTQAKSLTLRRTTLTLPFLLQSRPPKK
jgi:DNA topoisomerase-2